LLTPPPAVAFADVIVGVHVLAVIIGFGAVFAYPLLFAAAARLDPGVTPWLLRTRRRVGRLLVNPGLLAVLVAGIYLASDEHSWGDFFVGWGIAAVVVIGAIEGAIIIPRAGRLATLAERDLAATAVAAGGRRTSAAWSPEYASGYRGFALAGWALQAIVVVTVLLMTTHAGS
jgi:uncharacterized membrane protein